MNIPVGKKSRKQPVDEEEPIVKIRPAWRRSPMNAPRAPKDHKKLFAKMSPYFEKHYDNNQQLTLCDMAGEGGFESVTQMVNHARRQGGETMRGIGRGMLAVAAGYEEQAQEGARHAMAMLALIPQFDSEEPASQAPQRPFMPQREINLNITGVTKDTDKGRQLTAQEAYMQLIKHHTYEEIAGATLEAEEIEEGDYRVIDLGNSDD